MTPLDNRTLPNAADKAALKAIAVKVVTACPSLQDTAHEVASNLLTQFGVVGHDPDKVYFHRFKFSSSSSTAFTGWDHCCTQPVESMTLTQLVIHRFRVGDQDNADMLDVDLARRPDLRRWALQLRETHLHVQIGPNGALVAPDRYALYFADKARTLLTSASRFYRNLPWANLPPRPAIPTVNASTSITDLLTQVFQNSPGVVISETLGRLTSIRFMIEHMAEMATQGVKTLYVRRLLSDFAQIELNTYFKSGVMSDDLEHYLTRLGSDPSGQFPRQQRNRTPLGMFSHAPRL